MFCETCEKEIWHFLIRNGKAFCSRYCSNVAENKELNVSILPSKNIKIQVLSNFVKESK